jgi:signal transduction histidine kinase
MPLDVDAEILAPRAVLRDLVALSAIPVAWIGREPGEVAAGLADTLIGLLQLDFVCVRLGGPRASGAVEVTRGEASKAFPGWMDRYPAEAGGLSGMEIVAVGEGAGLSRGVVIPVGLDADAGVVAAACDRADFPTVTEQLLLRLAVNEAGIALRNACLIVERTRAEHALRQARNELAVKVAEQTAEQSALRRVATLVARGAPPEEVFAAVSEEVGHLLGVDLASICRYEGDGTITFVAAWGRAERLFPVGSRQMLEENNLGTIVLETGRSARVDRYAETATGPIGAAAREGGINSSLATPIVVDGRLWGVIAAGSIVERPLPADTEARLAEFTELLATAIASTQSRADLALLAAEQAALRRVATLVARRTAPEEVFESVTEEVGRLLCVEFANLVRFEPDGTLTFVATWSRADARFRPASRFTLTGRNLATVVWETGRPARMDDYAEASGPLGVTLRQLGIRSAVAAPVTVEGRLWGFMAVSSTEEQHLFPDAEGRLAHFTELVATAIANAESRAELTASRARVVAAADDTRRRIERDLHDGAQQQLVTLGLKLRSLASEIPAHLEVLHADVGEIARQLEDVLGELRELSHGIHPAVLSPGGLGPALKTLARRAPLPVEVVLRLPDRPPEGIEVAVYYVVAEALTNVAKHGRASVVVVEVEDSNDGIRLSVSDDGVGGADPSRGSGLLGLRDRIDALDATMTVISPPGAGTSIVVHFPVPSDVRSADRPC